MRISILSAIIFTTISSSAWAIDAQHPDYFNNQNSYGTPNVESFPFKSFTYSEAERKETELPSSVKVRTDISYQVTDFWKKQMQLLMDGTPNERNQRQLSLQKLLELLPQALPKQSGLGFAIYQNARPGDQFAAVVIDMALSGKTNFPLRDEDFVYLLKAKHRAMQPLAIQPVVAAPVVDPAPAPVAAPAPKAKAKAARSPSTNVKPSASPAKKVAPSPSDDDDDEDTH